jgi:hypothetical protein
MKSLNDEILSLLKALDKEKALGHLIVIGSWVTLFYKEYFKDQEYHPVIRTTDIDFLVPKRLPKGVKINVSKVIEGLGFMADFSNDGWVTFQKPELHIEFLMPRLGPLPSDVRSIPELGINARPLRHLWLLSHYFISTHYSGIKMKLPHPAAYGVHKLIISTKRKKITKRDNDRQQAEMVLTALHDPKDLKLLREILERLSKKERMAIQKAIQNRPLLKDLLKPHLSSS